MRGHTMPGQKDPKFGKKRAPSGPFGGKRKLAHGKKGRGGRGRY
jgi:hypothetical protein